MVKRCSCEISTMTLKILKTGLLLQWIGELLKYQIGDLNWIQDSSQLSVRNNDVTLTQSCIMMSHC